MAFYTSQGWRQQPSLQRAEAGQVHSDPDCELHAMALQTVGLAAPSEPMISLQVLLRLQEAELPRLKLQLQQHQIQ